MTSKTARGWLWTPEQKAWIKGWQRKLQNQHDNVIQYLRGIERLTPSLLQEANDAAVNYLQACKPLLGLDARVVGRKYQEISFEDANERLGQLAIITREWDQFTNREDVRLQLASAIAAERVRARQAERQLLELVSSPEFASRLAAQVQGLIALERVLILKSQPELDPRDAASLDRLLLVQIVRASYEGIPAVQELVSSFVHQHPAPLIEAVVRFALLERERYWVQHPSGLAFRSAASTVARVVHDAGLAVMRTAAQFGRAGTLPRNMPATYFVIHGLDYSV